MLHFCDRIPSGGIHGGLLILLLLRGVGAGGGGGGGKEVLAEDWLADVAAL